VLAQLPPLAYDRISSYTAAFMGPASQGGQGRTFALDLGQRMAGFRQTNGHFGWHFITTRHCEEFSSSSSPARQKSNNGGWP
jgi:hypothetical protein